MTAIINERKNLNNVVTPARVTERNGRLGGSMGLTRGQNRIFDWAALSPGDQTTLIMRKAV